MIEISVMFQYFPTIISMTIPFGFKTAHSLTILKFHIIPIDSIKPKFK